MAFCVFIATVLSSSVVVMTCRDPTAVFEKRGGEPFVFLRRDRDRCPGDVFVHERGGYTCNLVYLYRPGDMAHEALSGNHEHLVKR
jgi:hypothetical protein